MTAKQMVAAVLVAGALVAPTDALAHKRRPLTPRYAIAVAMDYWAKRDVYMPCDVVVYTFTKEQMREVRREWGSDTLSVWNIPTCSIGIIPEAERNRFQESPFEYCYAIQYSMGYLARAGDKAERIKHVPSGCDPDNRRRFLRRWEAKWRRR